MKLVQDLNDDYLNQYYVDDLIIIVERKMHICIFKEAETTTRKNKAV